MALAQAQRVTLLRIDEALAMTHRYELEVRSLTTPEAVGWNKAQTRVAVVRQRGRRKDFYLDLKPDEILFDGWELPVKADTEAGGVIAGNACFNLVGDPEVIRQLIETRAALPVSDAAKAKVIVTREARTRCDDEGQELLYPEIETHHAVIARMRERAAC
jgi:hypothetical protein